MSGRENWERWYAVKGGDLIALRAEDYSSDHLVDRAKRHKHRFLVGWLDQRWNVYDVGKAHVFLGDWSLPVPVYWSDELDACVMAAIMLEGG